MKSVEGACAVWTARRGCVYGHHAVTAGAPWGLRSRLDENTGEAPGDEADYEKVEQGRQEVANPEPNGADVESHLLPLRTRRGRGHDRHYEIIDERLDECRQRRSDNDGNCEGENVLLDQKCLEFAEHGVPLWKARFCVSTWLALARARMGIYGGRGVAVVAEVVRATPPLRREIRRGPVVVCSIQSQTSNHSTSHADTEPMKQPIMLSGRRFLLAALSIATLSVAACDDDNDEDSLLGPGSGVARGRTAFGVDDNNVLISFGLGNPTLGARKVAITGLQAGERILGIDFGPRDNRLYAVGSSSRLYVLDTTTGVAGRTSLGLAGNPSFTPALDAGNGLCVDFNPVPNLVRVQSTTRQNLRLRPDTGTVAGLDTPIAYVAGDIGASTAPTIAACAYTNSSNLTIPATTQLFAIDAGRDALVLFQGNPNLGQIATVGTLGVQTGENAGFDIAGAGEGAGTLYLSLNQSGGRSSLYTASASTGAATFIGEINHARPLLGIAISP